MLDPDSIRSVFKKVKEALQRGKNEEIACNSSIVYPLISRFDSDETKRGPPTFEKISGSNYRCCGLNIDGFANNPTMSRVGIIIGNAYVWKTLECMAKDILVFCSPPPPPPRGGGNIV